MKSQPNQQPDNNSAALNASSQLRQQFFKNEGAWFIDVDGINPVGPFSDKADAQMALMYHSVRAFWPSEKQLREFARTGK